MFKIGDIVKYIPGKYEQIKGSCRLDWAEEYCLPKEKYKVIDTHQDIDIRIKGTLNPAMPQGSIPDEIWVNALQFKKHHDEQ